MAISKTQRWLDLIVFLVRHRFPVDVDQVMEGVPAYRQKRRAAESKEPAARDRELAALRRMFERDKAELRDAGIPLETREYTIDHGTELAIGYELKGKDFYLPYLRLVAGDEPGDGGAAPRDRDRAPSGVSGLSRPLDLGIDDLQTAANALRRVRDLPASPLAREARTALSKLTFDAPPDALRDDPVLHADAPESEAVRATVRALRGALVERRRVTFAYYGIQRDATTDRDVAPWGLLFQHAHWYLIGADGTRDGERRVFRASRIRDGTLEVGPPGAYEIPAGFDASSYAAREAWELGEDEPVVADVRFAFPLSLWAERNGKGDAVERLEDGAAVRRFRVRQTDPFLRWLQSFAGDAVVVRPPGLRDAQRALARRTLEVYGD
ncbi:MAG: helix-turn-helix transcriptional regulator [Gemmatimonadota bacterium]